ncbi:MAG: FG-GAP-like repeat-containing protein [Terriglobales bacterium]
MAGKTGKGRVVSRRSFLKGMRWAPVLFLPGQIRSVPFPSGFSLVCTGQKFPLATANGSLVPHYPVKPSLDDLLRHVMPGADGYVHEKDASEIARLLDGWGEKLKAARLEVADVATLLLPSIEVAGPVPIQETTVRSQYGIDVLRRQFGPKIASTRERFVDQLRINFADIARLDTAEFSIIKVQEVSGSPPIFHADIRYDLVGTRNDGGREQRIGTWSTEWRRDAESNWRVLKWEFIGETVSRTRTPTFIDISSHALGKSDSYKLQMLRGTDYWRSVLDGACGIDVYSNNGLAVGDVDNDGLDDLYVCQPAGLPNRLYHNRGDGTFEDISETSGVNVLDNTSCALFADFENKGVQDLLVVSESGPLLFLNQGMGKYSIKRDAFKFARTPQGSFTQAAIADYDRDGHLDIYFCVYNYYVGLDQYHYPAPYFDARNGPPNFLFHNGGNATFHDRTDEAGLNVDNDRYSFACAWGDLNANGWPDLYVANDFGRSNLYRNNGDGTFKAISSEANVEDVGAGMSACWLDVDNDGHQDIYVGNMWSPAGLRVSDESLFHENEPEHIRALYRQHARGNSLYRNDGNGNFRNVAQKAGVDIGRWAWCSDSWDFDHDGYPDLHVANGYITGDDSREVSSFFWRQVVGNSRQDSIPSSKYEQGWNAINELIRSDASWSGRERNLFYWNNGDGTFSDISGTVGLDFSDDSRAFVLTDLDHDGRLEVFLKNRNAPQLRVLRNAMTEIGDSIAFRLQGTKSNRDAIGAAVTVEVGSLRQTKYLQAGSGFLAQHTKEIFFGIGKQQGTIRASIHWPSGLTEDFKGIPANHRIEIVEGEKSFTPKAFAIAPTSLSRSIDCPGAEPLTSPIETWLIEPLSAPEFSLLDVSGKAWDLRSFRGHHLLLQLWTTFSADCGDQMKGLQRHQSALSGSGLKLVGINLDDPCEPVKVQSFLARNQISYTNLLANQDFAGIYNIIYRYLFDRRRDLSFPTCFLINDQGMIVKLYQGLVDPKTLLSDIRTRQTTVPERVRRALPFPGTLYEGRFQRNDFTCGVALFQHGYLDQAAASFQQVIAAKPQDPEAYYNLGTLELRRGNFKSAREHLEQTVRLRPNYSEAWNNLGMLSAQEGQTADAIREFEQSLLLRPDYAIALLNLGNVYRRQRNFDRSAALFSRAVEIEPENPEANYSLGMLYAQQEQLPLASDYLQRAVNLRPNYADALNNLGVILIREQHYSEAEANFKTCIQVAPKYDQAYLNLARLYLMQKDNEKARDVLLALLRQQPENKVAQQTLEMLH